jgi:hypothetical protein
MYGRHFFLRLGVFEICNGIQKLNPTETLRMPVTLMFLNLFSTKETILTKTFAGQSKW